VLQVCRDAEQWRAEGFLKDNHPADAFLEFWHGYDAIPDPAREFKFHPKRRWLFDFAWLDQMVAVEVHGATFAGGRHVRGTGFDKDREKVNAATAMGWAVFEVTTTMLRKDPAAFVSQVSATIAGR